MPKQRHPEPLTMEWLEETITLWRDTAQAYREQRGGSLDVRDPIASAHRLDRLADQLAEIMTNREARH